MTLSPAYTHWAFNDRTLCGFFDARTETTGLGGPADKPPVAYGQSDAENEIDNLMDAGRDGSRKRVSDIVMAYDSSFQFDSGSSTAYGVERDDGYYSTCV
ncbi:MAG: hypothetical protein Q9163_002161 [Psora crenata]